MPVMKFTRICYFLAFSLVSFLLFSCDEEANEVVSRRTVFVYLGRDNDLSSGNEEKIASMLQGWNGKNGQLIFYQDLLKETPYLLEAYHENGTNKLRIISDYEEENSASAEVFERALKETIRRFPADSYGLILFSHASGWLPAGTSVSARKRSVVKDRKSEMELIDFAKAIPDGTFDFIVFESCLMAGIEVAYELKDKTTYILASSAEILSPGFKDTYAGSINYLFQPDVDLLSFARDAFTYVESQSGVYRSGTLSLIKTAGLSGLGRWIEQNITVDPAADLSLIQYFDRAKNHQFYDFEDYFSSGLDAQLREELSREIANCIIYKAATPTFMLQYDGFYIRSHSGLTTYVMQDKYPSLNEQYQHLKWYQEVLTRRSLTYKNP